MMDRQAHIHRLLDQVVERYHLPRNQENLQKWRWQPGRCRDKWRGTPRACDLQAGVAPPIVVNIENSLRSQILGFSVRRYFQEPSLYLESYLRYLLWHFDEIRDDVPIVLEIPAYRSLVFEARLLGSQPVYADDRDAWIAREPILHGLEATQIPLPRLTDPVLAEARRFYETLWEMVEGWGFGVSFVEWFRGPIGTATHLLGLSEALLALREQPHAFSELLGRLVEARLAFTRERSLYLNEPIPPTAALYNDEVNCPSLSPRQYAEVIWPHEKTIADFHGGFNYWHSCGDCTKLLPRIAGLPIELMHLGPWTEVTRAAATWAGTGTAFEICLHPIDDVLHASPDRIRDKIRATVRQALSAGPVAFTLEAGPIELTDGVRADVRALQQWVQIAREELSAERLSALALEAGA